MSHYTTAMLRPLLLRQLRPCPRRIAGGHFASPLGRWAGSRSFRASSRLLQRSFTASPLAKEEEQKPPSFFERMLGPKSCATAPGASVNRWAMVVPAFFSHMCIGSPYGWSVMSGTLTQELGFLTTAAADWSIAECTLPIQLVFAFQGLAAAVGGTWAMRVGPRAAMVTAAGCFGGGLLVGAAGIYAHSLPLLYLGYGVLGGAGVGLAYTPPLQALIAWFPDKKGLASGLTLAGFGSGALIFTPAVNHLMAKFAEMPTYLGKAQEVTTLVRDGKLFAEAAGKLQEVVMAAPADVAKLSHDLSEGIYVVGSGDTGAAAALGVCGAAYGAIMLASAFMIRTAPPGYKPAGWEPPATVPAPGGGSALVPSAIRSVSPNTVMRTPQFYALGTMFFVMAAGGISLMSVAKPMMSEVFSSSLPTLVTAAFASQYVQMLAAANLGGRLGWAAFSDKFGRRATFHLFTLGSIPLYACIPWAIEQVVLTGASAPLYIFVGSTFAAITFMGGTYAILPAYESDLFGSKYVGPVHGRMLLASSLAALAGPSAMLQLRKQSELAAISDLTAKVDPQKFADTFGATTDFAQEMIASKTLTISKLMAIVPPGTVDPSPFVYNSTMYAMAGLMGVAAISHAMVKPVDAKYFEKLPPATAAAVPLPVPAAARTIMLSSMASHMIPASVLNKGRQ